MVSDTQTTVNDTATSGQSSTPVTQPKMKALPTPSLCPICKKRPIINECGPWPPTKQFGPAPWYAGCYSMMPEEHFIGVNAENRQSAIEAWNEKVRRRRSSRRKIKS
jgi:hypothetical protein